MNRLEILTAAVVGLSLLVGCGKAKPQRDPPRPTKDASGGVPPGPAVAAEQRPVPPRAPLVEIARVAIVELYESHRDTFSEALAGAMVQFSEEHAEPLMTLTDEGLFVDPKLASAIETGEREHAGLEAAADVANLEQARVVVVYRTLFGGQGRHGGAVRYLVFARLPAVIPLPSRYPAADRWEFDIATDGAMPLAARAITGYPRELKELQLAEGRQDKQLLLSLGKTSKELPLDQPVEMTTASRTIAVSAMPIVADFEGKPGVEVIPAQNYGAITFTTRLMAIYRGQRPLWVGPLDDTAAAQEKAP